MKLKLKVFSEAMFADPITGVLTDEHSASSYGVPVIVIDGQVYGPSDVPTDFSLAVEYEYHPCQNTRLYESDEEIASRRTPESLAFVRLARACGYKLSAAFDWLSCG